MDNRPDCMTEINEPMITPNNLPRMARGTNKIKAEVTKIRQRVDRMIQTFERTHGIMNVGQRPDMEILEDMDELQHILHDITQKKKYQQKLTVLIVGYEETCGQRRHLLTQLQEFFSIYPKLNEEGDQKPSPSTLDLDRIAHQVSSAVRSAEAALFRLADIHAGIMSCLTHTISTGTKGKRGRNKLEKVLEQAKQDIVQLTDKLKEAQQDLTLKDQQLKELVQQNGVRRLESQHVKSQLEVTKRNLQVLQDETTTQRILLEEELRRQAGRVEELENQEAVKGQKLTNASTQWEILDFICEDEIIPVNHEEKTNNINNLTVDCISEQSELSAPETKFQVTDTDINKNVSHLTEQVPPSVSMFGQISSETALSTEDDKHSPDAMVTKEGDFALSLCPESENTIPSDTAPALHDGSMLPIEPSNVSEIKVERDNTSETSFVTTVSEEHNKIAVKAYASKESQTDEEQSKYSNPPTVTETFQKTEQSNNIMLSESGDEEHANKMTVSEKRAMFSKVVSQDSLYLGPKKSIDSSSLQVPGEDPDLVMASQPAAIINTDLEQTTKQRENVKPLSIASPASPESSLGVKNNLTDHSTSVQEEPDNASKPTPFSVSKNHNKLATLSSVSNTYMPSVAPLALYIMNTNIEDNCHSEFLSSSSKSDLISPGPVEDREMSVTSDEEVVTDFTAKVTELLRPSAPETPEYPLLHEDFEGALRKRVTEQENVSQGKNRYREEPPAKLLEISQRLHLCLQEIISLLMNNGFHSLVEDLPEGTTDCNEDEISRNLIQLEYFPAVLKNLLHSVTKSSEKPKCSSDEPLKRTYENIIQHSPSLLINDKTVGQHCNNLSVRVPADSDSACTNCLFTRLDEEYNRHVLQRVCDQGRIPARVYQNASNAMSEYKKLRQGQLRSLASKYVQYISWNRVENILQQRCLNQPHVKPALTKMKIKKQQVFLRWKEERERSQQERVKLSTSLNQMLQEIQDHSGIFLIKPMLSLPGRSKASECHRQIQSCNKVPGRPSLPLLNQHGALCTGMAPEPVSKKWKAIQVHTEIQPLVITPKLLEMDVHRYLCKECCVVSQIQSSSNGLQLRALSPQKLTSKQISSLPAL